jgi:hypothetical protein
LPGLEVRVKKMREKFAQYDSASLYQARLNLCKDTPPKSVESKYGQQMVVRCIIDGNLPDKTDTSDTEFLLWAKRWEASLKKTEEWESLQAAPYQKWSHWPVLLYVKLAHEHIKAQGFHKTTDPDSTRDALVDFIRGPQEGIPAWGKSIDMWKKEPLPDPLFFKEIDTIINYFLTEEGKSPYLKKAKKLLRKPFFDAYDSESTGLLASLPFVYASRKSTNRTTTEVNEPFGEVKQRGPLKLFLKRSEEKTMRTYPIVTYVFRDDVGRRFLWNASWPGEESLVEGKTYLLTGTVDSHHAFKDKHYTNLKRCSKFKECSADAPRPSFQGGAKRRPFKPECTAEWSLKNSRGEIDGNTYVIIKRLWKEDKKKRELNIYEPFPLRDGLSWYHFVPQEMVAQSSVKRPQGLDAELDEEILALVTPLQGLQDSLVNKRKAWFLVDEATGPLWDHRDMSYPNPPGDRTPPSQRKPRVFESQYEARTYGRNMTCGRLTAVSIAAPVLAVVPPMINMEDPDAWQKFKQESFKRGVNIFAHIDEQQDIEHYEPFMWHTLRYVKGFELLSCEPVHKSFNKSHSRILQGRRFVCLTGVMREELAERIKDAWRQDIYSDKLLEANVKSDSVTQSDPRGGGAFGSVPLHAILNSLVEPSPHRHYNLVVTDEISSYYLKTYGATVIEVNLQKEGVHDGLLLNWKKQSIISLTEHVVEVVNKSHQ